jgi:DNA helicase TIP49 (TBP-interacting protein)
MLMAAVASAVQIDTKVSEWREEGKADIVPGVLFIDEVGHSAVCCARCSCGRDAALKP